MISMEPLLIVIVLIVYGVLIFLAIKSRTKRRTWKILFWSSLPIPVVVCILAYLMIAVGASGYSNPTRTEIQAFGFLIAIFIGIGAFVLCVPGWVILYIKAFKKSDDEKDKEKEAEKVEQARQIERKIGEGK